MTRIQFQSVLVAFLFALVLLSRTAFAAPPRVEFDISAGNAAEKLVEFSQRVLHQADVQVLFRFDLMQPYQTNAVRGAYTPVEALRMMISETGIEYRLVTPKTFAINPPGSGFDSDRELKRKARLARADKSKRIERFERDQVEENVVVTGTHFTDVPVGADLITFGRSDFKSVGSLTVADLLKTLPQAFGGGPSEDTELGREAESNIGLGQGINLRGLGAGATLPLIDGRRMAPSGSDGLFADVMNIPLIVLDRVDVLADGTSAIYGSDAIGGVVNFVLRKDFQGAETQIDLGSVTSGAMQEYRIGQLFGTRWNSGRFLIAMEKYERDPLAAAARPQANSDLSELGGDNLESLQSNPGNVQIGNQFWAIRPRPDGSINLVAGERNLHNRYDTADVLPSQDHLSVFATGRQQINERLRFSFDGLYTERKVSGRTSATSAPLPVSPLNAFYTAPSGAPAGLPQLVQYSFLDDLGPATIDVTIRTGNTALGVDFAVARDWEATAGLAYTFERQHQLLGGQVNSAELTRALLDSDPQTAFNPYCSGSCTNPATIARIRSETHFSTDSNLRVASLSVHGPLAELNGGPLRLAVGVDYRMQEFDSAFLAGGVGTNADSTRNLERDVSAVFTELLVPLVGPENNRRGIESLQLSALARYEHYSDFGGTTTPRLGLRWRPIDSLTLRGTWAKSFRAPNLADIFDGRSANFSTVFGLPNPLAPGGIDFLMIRFGNNPELHEETANSWTAGFDFSPASLPELSFGATYFQIEFRDRVLAPRFADLLSNLALSGLIDRTPSAEERAQICSSTLFIGAQDACLSAPISAIFDLRLRNMALLQTRGIDLIGEYRFDTRLGKFKLGALGTYIMDFEEQEAIQTPIIERVDTQNHPVEFRMRTSLRWDYRSFEVTAFLNYADAYRDTVSVPARRVSSMTTMDLDLAYTTDDGVGGWLENTRFGLHIDNLWDQDPPLLNNLPVSLGYDQENADILGRVIRLGVQKSW